MQGNQLQPGKLFSSSRVNKIDHLGTFMRSWDDPLHPKNSVAANLRKTRYGNINKTGVPGNYRSDILSRWHPQFSASLEPGIKELVLVVIERLDWITYSSCEGHYYNDLSVDPVERGLGLLPRNEEEGTAINDRLNEIVDEVNRECDCRALHLVVVWEPLESELGMLPVLRLRFKKRFSASWESYFEQVDVLYKELVAKLRQGGVDEATS